MGRNPREGWRLAASTALALALALASGLTAWGHRFRFGFGLPRDEIECVPDVEAQRLLEGRPWQVWRLLRVNEPRRADPPDHGTRMVGPIVWTFECRDERQRDPPSDCRTDSGECPAERHHPLMRTCLVREPWGFFNSLDVRSDAGETMWQYRDGSYQTCPLRARLALDGHDLWPTAALLLLAIIGTTRARRMERAIDPTRWLRATRATDTRARLDDGRLVALDGTAPPADELWLTTAEAIEGGYREGDVLRASAVRSDNPHDATQDDRVRRGWRMVFALGVSAMLALGTSLYVRGILD